MVLEKNSIPAGDELIAELLGRLEKAEKEIDALKQRQSPVRQWRP